ncbi:MFS general substrate transporter [Polychaeton citri CBS 116435]|uniref:MFS general substrate transporter n=1 Tax=Polychaeton citri CBS 116435 TaxID=1314669 RepID=A0A9P4Q982_9PEZI|nr:MFS general substrate transporter [Polychaeton citri CBS 116435]
MAPATPSIIASSIADEQNILTSPTSDSSDGHGPSHARLTPESERESNGSDLNDLEQYEGYELKDVGKVAKTHGHASSSQVSDSNSEIDLHDDQKDQNGLSCTSQEETRIKRKLTTHLTLFVALLYLAAFLDRSNIGNAKVAGLKDDLSLTDSQFEWLLTGFYITYILFQWLALMYKVVPPHIWIAICVGSWGVLASLQALVTSWRTLLAIRVLLGIGEAAFGSGVPFYLSFFLKRDEHAFATGLFIAAAPLATSFASSLAYAIVSLGDKAGIASWRLLFLAEGFPAVVLSIWTWFWIPDSPATARWLTPRERVIAVSRLRKERSHAPVSHQTTEKVSVFSRKNKIRGLDFSEVRRTLRDPKAWLTSSIFFCCNVAFSSMPVFLPTIINQMGFPSHLSQALSAPPFLLATVTVLVTSHLSDRYRSRSIPLIIHALFATSGYLILAFSPPILHLPPILLYLATFPICFGFFSAVTLTISWTIVNQRSDDAKGTAQAVLQTIGQLGPLVGTRLYPDEQAKEGFVVGHSICAIAMAATVFLAFVLRTVLRRENLNEGTERKEGEDAVPLVSGSNGVAKAHPRFELML